MLIDVWIHRTEIAKSAKAGQFVHVLAPGHTLRRPIGICDVDGAKAAGLFPVWYKGAYEGYGFTPQNECLTIFSWQELIEVLERLK